MSKDKNGIEIKCENCEYLTATKFCEISAYKTTFGREGCIKGNNFYAKRSVLEARILELQKENKLFYNNVLNADFSLTVAILNWLESHTESIKAYRIQASQNPEIIRTLIENRETLMNFPERLELYYLPKKKKFFLHE